MLDPNLATLKSTNVAGRVSVLIGGLFWLAVGLTALTSLLTPSTWPALPDLFNNNPPLTVCIALFALFRAVVALIWPKRHWRWFRIGCGEKAHNTPRFLFWISFTICFFWLTAGKPSAPTWLWLAMGGSWLGLIPPHTDSADNNHPVSDTSAAGTATSWDSTIEPSWSDPMSPTCPATNPTTGFPMVGSTGCDSGGNGFGVVDSD